MLDAVRALLELGIGVEPGLWHAAGIAAWVASPHRDRCLRLLIELPDGLDSRGVDTEAAHLLGLVVALVRAARELLGLFAGAHTRTTTSPIMPSTAE